MREEEEKAREKTNFASGFFVFRRSEMWHPRRKRVGIIILAANGGRRRLAHHISPIRGRPKKRMADDMYTNRKQNSFICSVYVFPCFNTTQCDWCVMVYPQKSTHFNVRRTAFFCFRRSTHSAGNSPNYTPAQGKSYRADFSSKIWLIRVTFCIHPGIIPVGNFPGNVQNQSIKRRLSL